MKYGAARGRILQSALGTPRVAYAACPSMTGEF